MENGDQRFDHVAAVEIDEGVGGGDDGAEDCVVHHFREGAFGIAGEKAVRVLFVDGADEGRAREERRDIDQRQRDDGAAQFESDRGYG